MAISFSWSEAAGWYGISAIMTAYLLVSFEIVAASSVAYQVLNLTGALGVIVLSHAKGVKQSIVLNIFWALIALAALSRMVIE